jgi:hypothetical protein
MEGSQPVESDQLVGNELFDTFIGSARPDDNLTAHMT